MKPNALVAVIALATSLASTATTMPTQAACCPQVKTIVPPAKTTKEFQSRPLGITFQVPSNYRVIKLRNNAVGIIDPNTDQAMQCLSTKPSNPDLIPNYVVIYTKQIGGDNKLAATNLRDYLAKTYQTHKIAAITIIGQPGFKYAENGVNFYTSASFLSRDQKTLFTIAPTLAIPEDSAFQSTFDLILKTIAFK